MFVFQYDGAVNLGTAKTLGSLVSLDLNNINNGTIPQALVGEKIKASENYNIDPYPLLCLGCTVIYPILDQKDVLVENIQDFTILATL